MNETILRGDVWYADLSPVMGSEQGGVRPVVVIQNDIGNKHSPTIIIAPITSKVSKKKLPTHVDMPMWVGGTTKDSIILCEQIRTIDKKRLKKRISQMGTQYTVMQEINKAVKVSLGLA